MKVVILAGGEGTRLAEETEVRPKPMVEIGGRPILWHVMRHYAHHGFSEFVIALGYKGEVIKRYFLEYYTLSRSFTVDLADGEVQPHERTGEPWRVHLVDTGSKTNTGGRVRRLRQWLGDEAFLLTYGDGVSSVDLRALVDFHGRQGAAATVTAVHPPSRFGAIDLEGDRVVRFAEKPQMAEGWINGGFMVLEPAIFDHLPGDDTSLEAHALESLAEAGGLRAYRHDGFWQCMDTLRDKRYLESMWASGSPPWRVGP